MPAALGWVGLALLAPAFAFLILLPLAQRRPATLGRRGLIALLATAALAVAPHDWARWEVVAGVAGALAGLALLVNPWVVLFARAARVREALAQAAGGIRAKFEPTPSGIDLTTPPGRVRARGALGVALITYSIDPASKKHALLLQVFAKAIGNLRF